MSCTVNHLLIELGVTRRKLGHFIMEGRDNMEKCMICDLPAPDNDDWHSHHEELDRLRAVNAKLLEALENIEEICDSAGLHGVKHVAQDAIKEANK